MRAALVGVFLTAMSIACAGNTSQAARDKSDEAVAAALAKITPDILNTHISYLGDDRLEGRGTGTKGYDLAADYVAGAFKSMGLEPAGDRGSYLQRVPLLETTLDQSKTTLTLEAKGRTEALVFGKDYVSSGNPIDQQVAI